MMERNTENPSKYSAVATCVILLFALNSLIGYQQLAAQDRKVADFNRDWFFLLDSVGDHRKSTADDTNWRKLDLPHDWSIEMPFDSISLGSSGAAYLSGGLGWYKKTFSLPEQQQNKRIYIEFGGIYENSEIWINDMYLGLRPNGYLPIVYDITNQVHSDGKPNVITVKVNNRQPNSRFYAGSGIYRNVKLHFTNDVAVVYNGTFITTPVVNKDKAMVKVQIDLKNHNQKSTQDVEVETLFYTSDKRMVAKSSLERGRIKPNELYRLVQEVEISSPQLWSPDTPTVYRAVTITRIGDQEIDRYETIFGIRFFEFDATTGFSLNGTPLKIRGVCLHSDLGALGMAFNSSAARRQLQIMKDMGVNGIRTSHNPAASEFLDLCDEMGFIVMSETFDVWKHLKNPYDYHLYWDDWYEHDFIEHIKRDRNRPSLVVWCLGNEVQEQWHSEKLGRQIPRRLAAIVDSLDGTRPTTIANNEMSKNNPVLMSDAVDLIGYNYNHDKWADFLNDHPQKKFIVTESTSALASRGQYDLLPADSLRLWPLRWDIPFQGGNADKSISAYDHVHTPWGSTHEKSLRIFEKYPHISGMYVWTGFDYLGEPTPYTWPARSSYFGIVDLAGFPKDVYYLYQSMWTQTPVLHLFPHWNWQPGDTVDIVAYYNLADEIELLLNGRSLGKRAKADGKLHVKWTVPFESGLLTAVSYKGGVELLKTEKYTTGSPFALRINGAQESIKLVENELAFLEVVAVDEAGYELPLFNDKVQIQLEGDGVVVATDNGNPTDLTSFQSLQRKAYNGKLLVVVRGTKQGGQVTVRAVAHGVYAATKQLRVW